MRKLLLSIAALVATVAIYAQVTSVPAASGSSSATVTVNQCRITVSGGNWVITNVVGTICTAGSTALTAGTSQTLNIGTKAANTAWTGLAIYATTALSGTSITSVLVGSQATNASGVTVQILPQSYELTLAGTGLFLNVGGLNIIDFAALTIPLNFTSTGANLSALTAGVFDVYVTSISMPTP